MKAFPRFNGTIKSAGEKASVLKSQIKIRSRLEHLERMAAEAAHATESSVIQGLMKEAQGAQTDGARVAAWQALAKILGINTKDRAVSDMTDEEIEAELAEHPIEQDEATVH